MLAALAAAADVQRPATEPQEDRVAAAERLVAERLRDLEAAMLALQSVRPSSPTLRAVSGATLGQSHLPLPVRTGFSPALDPRAETAPRGSSEESKATNPAGGVSNDNNTGSVAEGRQPEERSRDRYRPDQPVSIDSAARSGAALIEEQPPRGVISCFIVQSQRQL